MQRSARSLLPGPYRPRHACAPMAITVRADTHSRAGAVCRGVHGDGMPVTRAVELGLLSNEGYLTALGFAFWRRTS